YKAEKAIVAPNPITNDSKVVFMSDSNGKATIRLNGISGKQMLIKEVEVTAGTNTISVPEFGKLQNGLYILTIELQGKVQQVKIIKK
ncbi:MAG: T9SS type A sorting domain-containing protein, partial [Hymenobacteraceae bacterium]|nr:T9SS type A sorting domain-containing protein [Hymenobacteraceae bacterium]